MKDEVSERHETSEPAQVSGAGCLKLLIVAIIIAAAFASLTK